MEPLSCKEVVLNRTVSVVVCCTLIALGLQAEGTSGENERLFAAFGRESTLPNDAAEGRSELRRVDRATNARWLLAVARTAWKQGDYDQAEQYAREAQSSGAQFGIFEDSPARVLDDIHLARIERFGGRPAKRQQPPEVSQRRSPLALPNEQASAARPAAVARTQYVPAGIQDLSAVTEPSQEMSRNGRSAHDPTTKQARDHNYYGAADDNLAARARQGPAGRVGPRSLAVQTEREELRDDRFDSQQARPGAVERNTVARTRSPYQPTPKRSEAAPDQPWSSQPKTAPRESLTAVTAWQGKPPKSVPTLPVGVRRQAEASGDSWAVRTHGEPTKVLSLEQEPVARSVPGVALFAEARVNRKGFGTSAERVAGGQQSNPIPELTSAPATFMTPLAPANTLLSAGSVSPVSSMPTYASNLARVQHVVRNRVTTAR